MILAVKKGHYRKIPFSRSNVTLDLSPKFLLSGFCRPTRALQFCRATLGVTLLVNLLELPKVDNFRPFKRPAVVLSLTLSKVPNFGLGGVKHLNREAYRPLVRA